MNPFRKGSTLPTKLQTKSLWLFGKARWVLGATLALLGTLGTLLGVPALNTQLRTDVPGLRCWFPVPMDDANFTVVMSPFVTVELAEGEMAEDGTGRAHNSRDGRELARLIFARLETSFASLDLDLPYELRSPDQMCPVSGATREARAADAERWATTINADVVIYGAILQSNAGDTTNSELQPEFFVTYRGFAEGAELVGPHELGRPLAVELPVQADALEGVADHPMNARAQALSLIALGLASYAVDDYGGALDRFVAADEVPNWPASAGKEMLYVLMGNTASRLAATTLDSGFVDEALDYFDLALEIDAQNVRALVGQASAIYQLALGNLETREGGGVDLDLLDEAEMLYAQAAAMSSPAAAEIALKTHFGLGQIYLVRHLLGVEGGDWLAQARREFQTVVDSYVAAGARNHDLVGHAYARLALIAHQIDGAWQEAVPLYEAAIALVTPRWQAHYRIDLGDLYAATDDVDAARTAYAEAQRVAELYGNMDMVERADERLAGLP
jgi:tetratricopeptide (TPR) repeat protein